jgi:hypothetical protein
MVALVVAVVALVVFSPPGRAAGTRFLASLRIATPQRVSVNLPSFTGAGANRQLLRMVSAIITGSETPMLDEPDEQAATAQAAGRLAGMTVRLPAARTDRARLTVLGAHAVALRVSLPQLRTMLTEAGRPAVSLPPAQDGPVVFTVRTPRAIRAEYGDCPPPPDTTLQGQLQGPALVTAANAGCVVLVETPPDSVDVPPGLDVTQIVGIALELSGMSPNQAQAFLHTLDWKAMLAISLPRFMRSYDSVQVDGVPGVLVTTAGRRGPTYELIWTADGVTYALAGYGSPADAVPLAASVTPAGGSR